NDAKFLSVTLNLEHHLAWLLLKDIEKTYRTTKPYKQIILRNITSMVRPWLKRYNVRSSRLENRFIRCQKL
ncbi:unnamed protein product, partial [Ilex paraguariensis]